MADKKTIVKFVTKEVFERAKNSGNYGDVSSDAQSVINSAEPLDVLKLNTVVGSPLRVISAKKMDETEFCNILNC